MQPQRPAALRTLLSLGVESPLIPGLLFWVLVKRSLLQREVPRLIVLQPFSRELAAPCPFCPQYRSFCQRSRQLFCFCPCWGLNAPVTVSETELPFPSLKWQRSAPCADNRNGSRARVTCERWARYPRRPCLSESRSHNAAVVLPARVS